METLIDSTPVWLKEEDYCINTGKNEQEDELFRKYNEKIKQEKFGEANEIWMNLFSLKFGYLTDSFIEGLRRKGLPEELCKEVKKFKSPWDRYLALDVISSHPPKYTPFGFFPDLTTEKLAEEIEYQKKIFEKMF